MSYGSGFWTYEHAPGFTPSRRREQQTTVASPASSTGSAWTTARCNRLLRPISSRIAMLRKHKLLHGQNLATASRAVPPTDGLKQSARMAWPAESHGLRFGKGDDDPEWAPDHGPRKRLKRTYSSKGSHILAKEVAGDRRNGSFRQAGLKIQLPMTDLPHRPRRRGCAWEEEDAWHTAVENESVVVLEETEIGPTPARGERLSGHTRDSFRRLAKSISPTEWMLTDGLYGGLDALLKATAGSEQRRPTGARSLLSTCLRKVPEHILEEQGAAATEDPEAKIDMSAVIYGELVSYGSSDAGGWKPLKEIVRAHGLAMLHEAIKDGTINPLIARGLAILCLQAHAYEEAERLCMGLVATLRLGRMAVADRLFGPETSVPLQTLHDVAATSKRWGFLYRQLAQLLEDGLIPIEWMASRDMIECWNGVIRSITQEDGCCHDASRLLQTVVRLSYRCRTSTLDEDVQLQRLSSRANIEKRHHSRMRQTPVPRQLEAESQAGSQTSDALTSTILNLTTVLKSLALLNSELSRPPFAQTDLSVSRCLQILVLQVYQSVELGPDGLSSTQKSRACLPLLAARIELGNRGDEADSRQPPDAQWADTMVKLGDDRSVIDTAALFLCSLSQCCGRVGPPSAFDYVRRFVSTTLDIPSAHARHARLRHCLPRIAVAAGFDFAEQSGKPAHLDWALETEELAALHGLDGSRARPGADGAVSADPARATTAAGFRWEEGIGEWVAKTPGAGPDRRRHRRPAAAAPPDNDDDEPAGPRRWVAVLCEIPPAAGRGAGAGMGSRGGDGDEADELGAGEPMRGCGRRSGCLEEVTNIRRTVVEGGKRGGERAGRAPSRAWECGSEDELGV